MGLLLNIETSTKNCSVALAKDAKVLAFEELNDGQFSHAEKLHIFIENVFSHAKIEMSDLDAVCVSKGPGSYTGLRIGVSAAKGLCFALDKPLISVDTLEILIQNSEIEIGSVIVPMLDARRLEVYSAIYDQGKEMIRSIKAEVIDENSYHEFLEDGKVYFIGDGAEKCKTIINHPNAFFLDQKFPSAKWMTKLSERKFQNKDFEDLAYFEPFYLKDFIAGKPKKFF